jgi:hypothetical protein
MSHRVFISFRISDDDGAAVKLKDALEAAGISAFVCGSLLGDDIAAAIANALDACELFIVLGTVLYGTQGDTGFSTRQELQFAVDHHKPICLIKRCSLKHPLAFQDPLTRLYLPASMLFDVWPPGERMPENLVDDIRAKLESAGDIAPWNAHGQQMCVCAALHMLGALAAVTSLVR